MNSDQAQLLTVKTTRPRFTRTQSLQSSAATNEYFSDYASETSSKSDDTKASYETPPSRISTPNIHQPQAESEMTLPSRPGAVRPAPLNIRQSQNGSGKKVSQVPSRLDDMSPPTPNVDNSPYIRFAIEQLTRDEELMGHGRHGSPPNEDFPVIFVPAENTRPPSTLAGSATPPKQNQPENPTTNIPELPKPSTAEEILLPVEPPEGQRWAEFGAVPTPLKFSLLSLYLLLCLLLIAGLVFSNIYTIKNPGLFDYDGSGTARYFIFQYLPQLLGILLILWLFVIEAAIYRAIPYFSMSMRRPYDRVLQDMRNLPSNFLLPDLSFFRTGEPLLGVAFLIFWLVNITVPLLSCLYQTVWVVGHGTPRWRWTTVQGVGWTLVVLFLLLALAIAYCIIHFRPRSSALMWDPRSLADIIVFFQRSNLCHDFERTEISPNIQSQIPPKYLRLGFWTTSQTQEIFYAVGEENTAVRRLSREPWPEPQEKHSESENSDSFDIERHRYSYASSFTRNIHSPFVRYRWAPWFLRDSAVLAWIIAALILLLAFLVVSFVNRAVQQGFFPLLPSRTRSGGFSASNFLYSFLPSLLGMMLFLAWQPIDTYIRASQPFANLSDPAGATAERSLLLSYNASLPLKVTFEALLSRDFKVAYISFVSLVAAMLPVLAGGVFTAQLFSNDNQVRMTASLPGYIALCVFTTIYALSYLIIWPKRKRYLPHNISTLADLLSFLYASQLLGDGALRNVRTKQDLVTRLVGTSANTVLTGDGTNDGRSARRTISSARYAFGIYIGRDGKEHLGIDRLQRPGSGEMLVTTNRRR